MTLPGNLGNLGYVPIIEPLVLTLGASFVQQIVPTSPGVFPSSTTVVINLTTPGGASLGSWAATVVPGSASWNIANSVCDAIPANSRYSMIVTYPTSPPTTYAWFEGPVTRP